MDVAEIVLTPIEIPAEEQRLHRAIEAAESNLRSVREEFSRAAPNEILALLDTHLMMLNDASLSDEITTLIRQDHCNAEWALERHRKKILSAFDGIEDAYLEARRDDVSQVLDRILRNLLQHQPLRHEIPDQRLQGTIVLARELSPSDLLLLNQQGVHGFITESGGPNSHVSIVARSMGIPGIVGVHHARQYVREDEMLILDGEQGVVIAEADEGILNEYETRKAAHHTYVAGLRMLRNTPAETLDGTPISLRANVELPGDYRAVKEVGADGVGLYRTEFLFFESGVPPSEQEHYNAYREMVRALDGAPLTIRTADLGGDKSLPTGSAQATGEAPNPALGLRGIRFCLRHPALFDPQLRAIVRASALGPVRLMIPMLSNIEEIFQVRHAVASIQKELAALNVAFDPAMQIGAMIEIPAVAIAADFFLEHLDFVSIGTNDLIQYALALDRENDDVNYLYDPVNAGVLRLIATVLSAGHRAGVPVAMCGEMAGDKNLTRLLLGLGLREFSLHPAALLEVKQVVLKTRLAEVETLVRELLATHNETDRRALLRRLTTSPTSASDAKR